MTAETKKGIVAVVALIAVGVGGYFAYQEFIYTAALHYNLTKYGESIESQKKMFDRSYTVARYLAEKSNQPSFTLANKKYDTKTGKAI